jgi:predicted transcriptional regulator
VKRASERPTRLGTGELEAQVMDVLWADGGRLTPAEVNSRLDSDRELAYTTVMTILVRLHDKGIVSRERRGRAWAYRPVLGREEHAAQRMNALLRDGGDQAISLARFVDNMTAKERAQLQHLLDARKRTR